MEPAPFIELSEKAPEPWPRAPAIVKAALSVQPISDIDVIPYTTTFCTAVSYACKRA